MALHQKILELRNKVGVKPIYTSSPIEQPVQIRSMNQSSDDPRLLKQYFCIWNQKDDFGCRPIKGCFSKSIQERGPSSNATYKITALWQHDQKEPLCKPSVLKEDEIGLYAEYRPDEGIPTCDRCVIQVRSGTVNNGSYGFLYIWDKMQWNEQENCIDMFECNLFEISPVTIPSQMGTFAIRGANGEIVDEYLSEETEDLIKRLPRQHHLELRSIINRHITLAQTQPIKEVPKSLDESKPEQGGLAYGYLINNLKL